MISLPVEEDEGDDVHVVSYGGKGGAIHVTVSACVCVRGLIAVGHGGISATGVLSNCQNVFEREGGERPCSRKRKRVPRPSIRWTN